MRRVHLKSLGFYGVMIGFILVLFHGVTAYGERNLKAPVKILGDYRINSPDLPDCLRSETITLAIAQSGIYITGKLMFKPIDSPKTNDQDRSSPAESAAKSGATAPVDPKTIKLNGLMQSQPFSLLGNTNQLGNCLKSDESSGDIIELKISRQDNDLAGQLKWSKLTLNFIGQRREEPKSDR